MTDIKFPFKNITIIGMGFMGTSLGLAIKSLNIPDCQINAMTRDGKKASELKALNCFDNVWTEYSEEFKKSDLIILAGTLDSFSSTCKKLSEWTKNTPVVMDLGSVKKNVIDELEPLLKNKAHYIPCHPMIGSEKSGHLEANSHLYENSKCILTPISNQDDESLKNVETFWEFLNVTIVKMDPLEHDEIVGHCSHLPHLIAVALVNSSNEGINQVAGQSWDDLTRIAKSSGALWSDILLRNKESILTSIDQFCVQLNNFKEHISNNDHEKIGKEFERAKSTLQD